MRDYVRCRLNERHMLLRDVTERHRFVVVYVNYLQYNAINKVECRFRLDKNGNIIEFNFEDGQYRKRIHYVVWDSAAPNVYRVVMPKRFRHLFPEFGKKHRPRVYMCALGALGTVCLHQDHTVMVLDRDVSLDIGHNSDECECSVCLEDMKVPTLLRPCMHVICWVCSEQVDICPFCRSSPLARQIVAAPSGSVFRM